MSTIKGRPLPGQRSPHEFGRKAHPHAAAATPRVGPASATAQPASKRPVAPPVYRPRQAPNALQAKSAARPLQRPPVNHTGQRPPTAPPVYRPQPAPKVLQRKAAGSSPQPARPSGQGRAPVAPPVYRPQHKQVLQPTMNLTAQGRTPPKAPPVYRPGAQKAVQPLTDSALRARNSATPARANARRLDQQSRQSNAPRAPLSAGQTANRGGSAVQPHAHAASHPHANGGVVQRKMGFELETENKVEEYKEETGWKPRGREKDVPIYVEPGLFVVECDTLDNMEFIIKEQDRWSQLQLAADKAVALVEQINRDKDNVTKKVEYDRTGKWQGRYRIKVADDMWKADGQATQGVKLEDLPNYLRTTLNSDAFREHQQATANVVWAASPAVVGLTRLLIQFVLDFKKWKGTKTDEGPKNAQDYMHRTPFSSMYDSLSLGDQTAFKAQFVDQNVWKNNNPVSVATGVGGDARVIPNTYLDSENSFISNKTTLQEWIRSIFAPHKLQKDYMSPPDGWRGSDYGMGLMDMDTTSKPGTPLALLEYRKTDNRVRDTTGKSIQYFSWVDWMQEQYERATEWNKTMKTIEEEEQEEHDRGMAAVMGS